MTESAPPPFVLWLWKNGPKEYWAFVDSNPGDANGDPVVLGEPCGYALLKDWPPTTPAEVEALSAERDAFNAMADRYAEENITLRARVAGLERIARMLSGFAEKASTLDWDEDHNVTWAAVVAAEARAALSPTPDRAQGGQ